MGEISSPLYFKERKMAVAYNILVNDKTSAGKHRVVASIAYTAEPYSSGVPVVAANLNCPNALESLVIIDDGFPAAQDRLKFVVATSVIRRYTEGAAVFAETTGNQTFTVIVEAIGW
jgi:hypothetical protein